MLPKFVYFDEYSTMHGRISIQDMLKRVEAGEDLSESDRTFMSLLELVGADLDDLQNQTNYEYMKAELESASISISDEMFEYWAQNKQLRVEFDLSAADPNDLPPLNEGTILHVRIWNNRHRVSVPFDDRSKGFVWFFSFLTYFSSIEEQEECDLVLLLDEPGLNLHALAQHDFLRFIDERLAPKHQVIYTTHSPFMINLNHLDRIRTVQDVDDRGTVISSDTLSNDQDTVFPLQVALGHNLAHTLFLAPHCLMVNSAADLIYLQILGEICAGKGYQRLDPRWVVIPVGNADNLPMFVSLLGENYVSVAVLMDVTPKNKAKMDLINKNSVIQRNNPVRWVEVQKIRTADIEDIFEPAFYLRLVNESLRDGASGAGLHEGNLGEGPAHRAATRGAFQVREHRGRTLRLVQARRLAAGEPRAAAARNQRRRHRARGIHVPARSTAYFRTPTSPTVTRRTMSPTEPTAARSAQTAATESPPMATVAARRLRHSPSSRRILGLTA